jgi:tetratricopeptide (TPR) repeat protein
MYARALHVVSGIALAGALLAPITLAAPPQQDEAAEHMRQGMALIQGGQPQEALEEFEQALELTPESASGHYYAGMALGQLQRFQESLDHFLVATELDPGNGQAHLMACRSAYSLQDYDEAWTQAIYASQAGIDMTDAFAGLEVVSERPDDFEARMSNPRVFVAELDLSHARPTGATPDDVSGGERGPDRASTTGLSTTIGLRAEDLIEARRQFGFSLARSPSFYVSQSPERATYVLLVEIDDVETMSGLAKLIDPATEEVAVMRAVTLPASVGSMRSVTDRVVGFFEEWLAENR